VIICHCTATTKKEIIEILEIWPSLEKVKEYTGAGIGCGSCLNYVSELANAYRRKSNRKKSNSSNNKGSPPGGLENT
jgi:NAD(P)H-nitrite reductase large subunit